MTATHIARLRASRPFQSYDLIRTDEEVEDRRTRGTAEGGLSNILLPADLLTQEVRARRRQWNHQHLSQTSTRSSAFSRNFNSFRFHWWWPRLLVGSCFFFSHWYVAVMMCRIIVFFPPRARWTLFAFRIPVTWEFLWNERSSQPRFSGSGLSSCKIFFSHSDSATAGFQRTTPSWGSSRKIRFRRIFWAQNAPTTALWSWIISAFWKGLKFWWDEGYRLHCRVLGKGWKEESQQDYVRTFTFILCFGRWIRAVLRNWKSDDFWNGYLALKTRGWFLP